MLFVVSYLYFTNYQKKHSAFDGFFLHDAIKNQNAMCLDGSAPLYYYSPGWNSGSNKWYIHFQYGGWCTSFEECQERSFTNLGSTLNDPPKIILDSDYFSYVEDDNPLLYNWNKVFIRYCDGGSFSGDTDVVYENTVLHFRGKNIMDSIFDDLISMRGLNKSTDVVISGSSAGGLATFLHLDYLSDKLKSLEGERKIVGLPDSGFFLDLYNYRVKMRWVFYTMNCREGVNQKCINSYPDEEKWKCFFAEYVAPFISTPIYAIQSKFDTWQVYNVVLNDGIYEVNSFGDDFMARLKDSLLVSNKNSGFIDSCFHHCGPWRNIRIEKKTWAEGFRDWYENIETTPLIQNRNYICKQCCG